MGVVLAERKVQVIEHSSAKAFLTVAGAIVFNLDDGLARYAGRLDIRHTRILPDPGPRRETKTGLGRMEASRGLVGLWGRWDGGRKLVLGPDLGKRQVNRLERLGPHDVAIAVAVDEDEARRAVAKDLDGL